MVKNNFTPEKKKLCNDLLTSFFQMNQDCDNIAYALDSYLECPKASSIYHLKFAHIWPSDTFADHWSEILVNEGIVPHRGSQAGNDEEYTNIVDAFEDNYRNVTTLKDSVLNAIEILDYEKGCKVLVLELEEFARIMSGLVHQSDIWRGKAKKYLNDGKVYKFDIDFEDFTVI